MGDEEYYLPPKMLSVKESVRKRPGMYFGTTGERGLQHVFLEIFSNAVDAVLKHKKGFIKVHSVYPEIIIEDDGCGLPFDERPLGESLSLAESYLTTLHKTRSADNHAPHVHLFYTFGVGLAAVNYASSKLEIESWRNGELWHVAYCRGEIVSSAKIISENGGKGTKVTLIPDEEIFEDSKINERKLRSLVFQAVHLFPGLMVEFLGEKFSSSNGLSDLLEIMSIGKNSYFNSTAKHFSFSGKINDYVLEVALTGRIDQKHKTDWRSWANGKETPQNGNHVDGVKKAFKSLKWKPQIGLVNLLHYDPQFTGPTREKLQIDGISEEISMKLKPLIKGFLEEIKF